MANAQEGLGLPGKHQGRVEESHSGMEVRAEKPENPQGTSEQKELRAYRMEEFRDNAGHLATDAQFVVFEDSTTGKTYIDSMKHVSADWSVVGMYDRVIIFDSQSEAEAYAASRRR